MKTILLTAAILLSTLSHAQEYNTDLSKSKLEWKGTKKIGEHFGTINIASGVVTVSNNKITGGVFKINMKTIQVKDTDDKDDQEDIISDISSKQFFNVKNYPYATFKLTSITDGTAKGTLNIKGNEHMISFPVTQKNAGNVITVEADWFSFDRQNWKLKFSNFLKEGVLDDPLQAKFHIEIPVNN